MSSQKKYTVFVSSTYEDLKVERDQIIKSILELGHIPVGMEMFSAADEQQWQIIKKQIDEIDYYVALVAHAYGSVNDQGTSYTEMEYDYAVSQGVPVLGFVIDEKASWPGNRIEKDAKKKKSLSAFKKKVKSRLIQFWQNGDDLHGKVSISLSKAMTANPRTGWIRATVIPGPEVVQELTRLSVENAALRANTASLLQSTAKADNVILHTVEVLSKNKIPYKVRKTSSWNNSQSFTKTLMELFGFCAPYLITEQSEPNLAINIAATSLQSSEYYSTFPIGTNVVSRILADFAALDLVQPSQKKRSMKDTDKYWTLSTLGKQVMKESRRLLLEAGLAPATTAPTNGASTTDQPR